jgi:hypothetical protein
MRAVQYSLFSDTLDQQFDALLTTSRGQLLLRETVARARALRAAGYTRYGIKAILEAVRYDRAVQLGPVTDDFAINNNFSSRLARHIMSACPDLAGFFEVRRLHDSDRRPTHAFVVPIR